MASGAWNLLKFKRALWDALFPIHCLGCRIEGAWLCPSCRAAVRIAPLSLCAGCGRAAPGGATHADCRQATSLSVLVSPYHYADPVLRALIKEYKYHGAAGVGEILSGLTAAAAGQLKTLFPAGAVVVPMPLHPARERARGFNQAATIAAALAAALGCETRTLIERVRRTEEQARLEPAEREENCRDAFRATPFSGRAIIVDDVITSGATMAAAAAAMKKAGDVEVTGFALAHGRGDRLSA